jgi:hypothetical protein
MKMCRFAFFRSFVLSVLSAALFFSNSLLKVHAAQNGKPNVIFIMSDDQGSVDAACYGAKDLVTPGIDALAARGVRFTQFYSAAPVCSPSRAAMLTSCYPWLVGMPNNAPAPPTEADDQLETLTGNGISASAPTMADMFRSAGYSTAHIGKWHLGSGAGHKPLDKGFEYSFGFMGGCIDNYTHFCYWSGPNRHDLWENNQRVRLPGHYFPDLMLEKAEAFITSHRDKPFFMYFAMNMPHYPYQGEPKWLEHYKNVPYPRNLYAAFVSTLDERVQRLMKFLEDSGLRGNTITAEAAVGHIAARSSACLKAASVCQQSFHGRAIYPKAKCEPKSRTAATGCRPWRNLPARNCPKPISMDAASFQSSVPRTLPRPTMSSNGVLAINGPCARVGGNCCTIPTTPPTSKSSRPQTKNGSLPTWTKTSANAPMLPRSIQKLSNGCANLSRSCLLFVGDEVTSL